MSQSLRTGVYKRFTSRTGVVNALRRTPLTFHIQDAIQVASFPTQWEAGWGLLSKEKRWQRQNETFAAGNALGRLARSYASASVQRALEIEGIGPDYLDWLADWKTHVCYAYWSVRIRAAAQERLLLRLAVREAGQYHGLLSLQDAAAALAHCVIAGWDQQARDLAGIIEWGLFGSARPWPSLDIGLSKAHLDSQPGHSTSAFWDGGDYQHRRTQHFVRRLYNKWAGRAEHDIPACAFDEPIYERLLQSWDTPDGDALVDDLLAACDRHTHETRVSGVDDHFDHDDHLATYDAYEINMIRALRRRQKLETPALDHPLVQTALARPFPKSEFPTDPLIERFLDKASEVVRGLRRAWIPPERRS